MRMREFLFNTVKGSVAIEFALITPILLILLSGTINFGLILVNQNLLNQSASAGILYAFGNSSNTTLIQNAMSGSTPNLSPLTTTATQFCQCAGANVSCSTVTCSDGTTPAAYVSVTAQSQVTPILFDLFSLPSPFVTTSKGTVRTN
jgi:Flp pilus assembly protein TadG